MMLLPEKKDGRMGKQPNKGESAMRQYIWCGIPPSPMFLVAWWYSPVLIHCPTLMEKEEKEENFDAY